MRLLVHRLLLPRNSSDVITNEYYVDTDQKESKKGLDEARSYGYVFFSGNNAQDFSYDSYV